MTPVGDMVMGAVRGIVAPVAQVFALKQRRKTIVQTIQAQAAHAAVEGDVQVSLKRAEWENIAQRLQGGTWKDEFITLVVFAPFITALAGAVLTVFGYPELSRAATDMLTIINDMDINYGNLLMLVTCAGLGIRMLR